MRSKGRRTAVLALCIAIAMLALTDCVDERTDPAGSSENVGTENPVDSAVVFVGVDDSRFTVLVSTYFGIGAYHILRKRLKELVARHFCLAVNNRLNEKFFISRQCLLSGMLLQDDKVAACICPGVVGEGIVGQTQCGHQIGTFHHFHSDERRCGVHHTLRGDKGYQSALTYLVIRLRNVVRVQKNRARTGKIPVVFTENYLKNLGYSTRPEYVKL